MPGIGARVHVGEEIDSRIRQAQVVHLDRAIHVVVVQGRPTLHEPTSDAQETHGRGQVDHWSSQIVYL